MNRVAKKRKLTKQSNGRISKYYIFGIVASFLIGMLSLVGVQWWGRHQLEENDHLQPLKITNLTYCNGEKLDMIVSNGGNKPLVVYIHGGGWQYGSKVGGATPFFMQLVERGYAVASINYRLSDRVKFPNQIYDVQCAVRFIKTNAELFGVDGNNIVLAGLSSGANLALMAGLNGGDLPQENKLFSQQTNDVQGIIAMSAHYDLTDPLLSAETKENIAKYLSNKNMARNASPINYLNKPIPILLFHGKNDRNITIEQATNFYERAHQAGYPVQLVEVKNADHNLWSWFGRDSPNSGERLDLILKFLDEVVR